MGDVRRQEKERSKEHADANMFLKPVNDFTVTVALFVNELPQRTFDIIGKGLLDDANNIAINIKRANDVFVKSGDPEYSKNLENRMKLYRIARGYYTSFEHRLMLLDKTQAIMTKEVLSFYNTLIQKLYDEYTNTITFEESATDVTITIGKISFAIDRNILYESPDGSYKVYKSDKMVRTLEHVREDAAHIFDFINKRLSSDRKLIKVANK